MSRNPHHIRSTPSKIVPDLGVQTREQKIKFNEENRVKQAAIVQQYNFQREMQRLKKVPEIQVVEIPPKKVVAPKVVDKKEAPKLPVTPRPSIAQPSKGIVQKRPSNVALPPPTKGPLIKNRSLMVNPSIPVKDETVLISNQIFTKKTSSKK